MNTNNSLNNNNVPNSPVSPHKRERITPDRFSPSRQTEQQAKRIKKVGQEATETLSFHEARKLTPQKKYSVVVSGDQIEIQLTPTSKKETKQKLTANKTYYYRFKDANGKSYVGLTRRNPWKRAFEHCREASKKSHLLFHKALRDPKKQFTFGVYPIKIKNNKIVKVKSQNKEKEMGIAGKVEKTLIKAKKALKEGYNSIDGGGEGSGKNIARKLTFDS